jgi:hypothetical protein
MFDLYELAMIDDWELESVDPMFDILYSIIPIGECLDHLRWKLNRNSKFDSRSYYEVVLRGSNTM